MIQSLMVIMVFLIVIMKSLISNINYTVTNTYYEVSNGYIFELDDVAIVQRGSNDQKINDIFVFNNI